MYFSVSSVAPQESQIWGPNPGGLGKIRVGMPVRYVTINLKKRTHRACKQLGEIDMREPSHHRGHVSHHAAAESSEVVAAFQRADDLAAAVLGRDRDGRAGHLL